jgi:type I restriction enzyme S subunit
VRFPHIVTKQNTLEQTLFGEERPEHSKQFDDAVAITTIVRHFASNEKYPLGRKKTQKLLYLFRRKQHISVSNFKEKAAGPYDSDIRYNGGEKMAISSKYIIVESSNRGSRFRLGKEWQKSEEYINKWDWGRDVSWLKQTFEYKTVDDLEVLATVDNAMLKLKDGNVDITWQNVKNYIHNSPEWKDKLKRECFSDLAIQEAIRDSFKLFGNGGVVP